MFIIEKEYQLQFYVIFQLQFVFSYNLIQLRQKLPGEAIVSLVGGITKNIV